MSTENRTANIVVPVVIAVSRLLQWTVGTNLWELPFRATSRRLLHWVRNSFWRVLPLLGVSFLGSTYTHHFHLTANQGVSSNYLAEAWEADINLVNRRSAALEEQKTEAWQMALETMLKTKIYAMIVVICCRTVSSINRSKYPRQNRSLDAGSTPEAWCCFVGFGLQAILLPGVGVMVASPVKEVSRLHTITENEYRRSTRSFHIPCRSKSLSHMMQGRMDS